MMAEPANKLLPYPLQKTVVIAEDNVATRRCLSAHLEAIGYNVLAAVSNGEEAVDAALKLNPSLVVMDVKMPKLDGLSAARTITSQRNIPIVFVSGLSDEKTANDALACGVAAYIVKPVTKKTLLPAITIAMARHEELNNLRSEVNNLRETLETRKLVEKAKGILMKRCSISEEEAYKLLQLHSQKENKKLREIASMVLDASKII